MSAQCVPVAFEGKSWHDCANRVCPNLVWSVNRKLCRVCRREVSVVLVVWVVTIAVAIACAATFGGAK